jgi:hypothetical protein
MGALITVLVLAFVAWAIFTQVAARQQTSISCSCDLATARRIVSKSFGIWWNAVPGRGDDNYRPKRGSKAPVLSISYGTAEGGGCNVDIWCSHGVKNYGVLNHAQLVWRKKRAVVRALAQAEVALTQPGGSETTGVGSPRQQVPAQPAIETTNRFDAGGIERVPTRMPEAGMEAGSVSPLRPMTPSGRPMAPSGQRPRGRHSRPDAGIQAPAAGSEVTRRITRPLPVHEMTGGVKAESGPGERPMRAKRGTGSANGSSIIDAWLNELEATQPRHGPLLRSTLDRVGNLPAVSDDGTIYTVSNHRYWYAAGFAHAKETGDEPTMVRKETEAEFWESVQHWIDSVEPLRMMPDVVPSWLARLNPVWNPVDA